MGVGEAGTPASVLREQRGMAGGQEGPRGADVHPERERRGENVGVTGERWSRENFLDGRSGGGLQ